VEEASTKLPISEENARRVRFEVSMLVDWHLAGIRNTVSLSVSTCLIERRHAVWDSLKETYSVYSNIFGRHLVSTL
jgi:hypothetical protein